jgi:hypothetical protein
VLDALEVGASEGDAHEDGELLRELQDEALEEALFERELAGDTLESPLAVWRSVLLTLAVTPDAEERGERDAPRVPDSQAVVVLETEAHADASALRDTHPDALGEAAVERDAEAQAVAVAHFVEAGVAATLAVLVTHKEGVAEGEAHEEKVALCEAHKDALGVKELERENAGLELGSGTLGVAQSGEADPLKDPVAQPVSELEAVAQADASALREVQPVELGEAVDERDAEAYAVVDAHNVESGVAVALTEMEAQREGTADGDAREDGEALCEEQEDALGDAPFERVKRGDPLDSPLAVVQNELLALAVTPDAEDRGDEDALRVPDAQTVAAPDAEAQTDASALRESHPVVVCEAAVERDAEAHGVADPQLEKTELAVPHTVLAALEVGATDGDAHDDGVLLRELQEEALCDTELERERIWVPLCAPLAVLRGVLLALADTPDPEKWGDNVALKVPDTHAVAVPDAAAQAEGSAL